MSDLTYYEAGYVETGYFERTLISDSITLTSNFSISADVDIADTTGYYIPDYIEAGYLVAGGVIQYASASLSSAFAETAQVSRIRSGVISVSSAFAETAQVSRIRSGVISVSSSFTQTSIGSRTKDIDMYAFTSSSLSLTAERFREVNSEAAGYFSVAIDVSRIKSLESIVSGAFTSDAIVERSRAFDIETQAAFSFTASVERLKSLDSELSVSSSLSAVISHIEGADIVLTPFANLSVDANTIADSTIDLTTAISLSCAAGQKYDNSAVLNANSSLYISRYNMEDRPRNLTGFESDFSSAIKKFGTHSHLGLGQALGQYNIVPAVDQDWIYEQWFYINSGTSSGIIANLGSFDFLEISLATTRKLRVIFRFSSGVTFTDANTLNVEQWYHLAIIKNSSMLSIYLDGIRVFNSAVYPGSSYAGYGDSINLNIGNISRTIRTDETSFHKDTTLGYDPTSSSITVPTSARSNDLDTTVFLYHFDNNLIDDVTITQIASASLSSQASITATISGPRRASSDINAQFAISTQASVDRGADLTAFSNASLSVTGNRIKFAQSDLSSSASLSVDSERITDVEIAINSQLDLSSGSSRIRNPGVIDTDAVASQLTAVAKISDLVIVSNSEFSISVVNSRSRDFAIEQASEFSQDVDAIRLRYASSEQSSQFNLDSSVDKLRPGSSDLDSAFSIDCLELLIKQLDVSLAVSSTIEITASGLIDISSSQASEFTQSILYDRFRNTAVDQQDVIFSINVDTADSLSLRGSADLASAMTLNADVGVIKNPGVIDTDAVASQLTAVAKIADFFINCETAASMSVTAFAILDTVSNQTAASTLDVTVSKLLATATSNQSSQFDIVAVGTTNITAESDLSSSMSITADGDRIANSPVVMSCQASQSADAERIRESSVSVNSNSLLTTDVTRIRNPGLIDTDAIAIEITVISRIADLVVNISSAFSLTAEGRDIAIETFVYVIPPETTVWKITSESRNHQIPEETRNYIIRRY